MYEQTLEILRAELVRVSYERNKAEAEVERLQTRVDSLETALANAVNADWHNAEIERLRKTLGE